MSGSGLRQLPLLWLRLSWLLLLQLLLLCLRQMMAYDAPGGRAEHRMMPRYVSCYGTDRGALDAAFCLGAARCDQ